MKFVSKEQVLVVWSLLAYQFNAQTVNLQIADGLIVGSTNRTVRNNVTYTYFRGIPFAKPPLGDLRFTAPVKNDPWEGTLDATQDKSECTQFDSDDYIGTTVYGSEDCLYINVYTPDVNATNLTVLVWIHGGTFLHGNSSYELYPPDFFLEEGLIVVSFNYRLGVFGYLSTEDATCPGNWGSKDQILALKWVQENIGYFGGDPNNVTIFGESAGAVSVHLLLQTNLTEGLFHKAIMDSGVTTILWGLNTRAKETASSIGTQLGILTTNSSRLVNQLRRVNADTLLRASWAVPMLTIYALDGLAGLIYGPTMEPDIAGAVYVRPSDTALRNGNFSKVPVLLGFNSNEAAAVGSIPGLLRFYLAYYDIAIPILTPWSLTKNSTTKIRAGREIKSHYFNNGLITFASASLIHFISIDQFARAIRRAAEDMAPYTSVYLYEFGYVGEATGITSREFEGTGHAEDLSYLFVSDYSYSAIDTQVSENMVLLWSNFAKYGDPTPVEDSRLNNTIWLPVNASSSDVDYLTINATLTSSVNPIQEDWEFYQGIWEKYGQEYSGTTY